MSEHRVRLGAEAMGCRFEFVLAGESMFRLRGAGEDALAEVERLHRKLSRFEAASAISRINREAARHPVRVDPELYELLRLCRQLWDQTDGAFDITVGAQLTEERTGVAASRSGPVGFDLVELDDSQRAIRFTEAGVRIDLGAIGKGWALDRAAEVLREVGIQSALLHGGTSSVAAVGAQEDGSPWPVAVARPGGGRPLARVRLADRCLGVSGPRVAGRPHIVDPRRAGQTSQRPLAAVTCGSAAVADALSTSLLVDGARLLDRLELIEPGAEALLVEEDPVAPEVLQVGNHWEML